MNQYLLGYRDGCSDYSWAVNLFFDKPLPVDTKLTRKELLPSYKPMFGGTLEPCDYYIVREF